MARPLATGLLRCSSATATVLRGRGGAAAAARAPPGAAEPVRVATGAARPQSSPAAFAPAASARVPRVQASLVWCTWPRITRGAPRALWGHARAWSSGTGGGRCVDAPGLAGIALRSCGHVHVHGGCADGTAASAGCGAGHSHRAAPMSFTAVRDASTAIDSSGANEASAAARTAADAAAPAADGATVMTKRGPVPRTHAALFGKYKVPARAVAEIHPTKNSALPAPFHPHKDSVYWQCPHHPEHVWHTQLRCRWTNGHWSKCPVCANRVADGTNTLAATAPDVAAMWHPTRNSMSADEVVAGANIAAWWLCPVADDHEFKRWLPDQVQNRRPCPCCTGKQVSKTNSVATLYPAVAAQWHPTKNYGLTPDQVRSQDNRLAWFKCPAGPDHEWQARVRYRTVRKRGCPFCAGQKVSVTNSLASLAPGIAEQWHPTLNGDLSPADVTLSSGKKVWWAHKVTGKPYEAIVSNKTTKVRRRLNRSTRASTRTVDGKDWDAGAGAEAVAQCSRE